MASLNEVRLIGNLTRDVEMRYTPGGMGVCQLGLATNRKWRDKQTNEVKEEVTFVDIDCFGKTAELAHQYLIKGSPVLVLGRLKLDTWDDKTSGEKRSKLKVVCENLQFLGAPKQGAAPAHGQQRPAQQSAPEDLDIPF